MLLDCLALLLYAFKMYLVYSALSDMLCTLKNVCCFRHFLYMCVHLVSFTIICIPFLYIGSVNTFYFEDCKCMKGLSKNSKKPRETRERL